MLVRILQLFSFPFLICLGSELNQSYQDIFQDNPVFNTLNPSDGQTVTTQQLKTILTAFQKDYVARISKLQNDFKITLRYQEHRIQSLEKKTAEQAKIISTLQHDFPTGSSKQEPSDGHILLKEKSVNSSGVLNGEIIVTDAFPIINELNDFENKKFPSIKSKRHNEYGRREKSVPRELTRAVVAFYAYMSANLPSDVAAPHHVLIFDHVRTNIGNGYHSSTGVFIVPETGVYVFIWSFRNGDDGAHSSQLMINSEEWGITHSNTAVNAWSQSTGCVVAHVNKGDDVFVKTSGYSIGYIYSNFNGRTSFSGWKIG